VSPPSSPRPMVRRNACRYPDEPAERGCRRHVRPAFPRRGDRPRVRRSSDRDCLFGIRGPWFSQMLAYCKRRGMHAVRSRVFFPHRLAFASLHQVPSRRTIAQRGRQLRGRIGMPTCPVSVDRSSTRLPLARFGRLTKPPGDARAVPQVDSFRVEFGTRRRGGSSC
jgi:hypothetical protein